MKGEVVSITARMQEAPPLEIRRRGYDECGHHHVDLDLTLRTVNCRDCGEERLDPFEHLAYLAREWRHWALQIERLNKLEHEYADRERAKWERARDRHLHAHPDHALDWTRTGWSQGECEPCYRLISDGRRWRPVVGL